jgi:hypothetical protein
MEIPKPPLLLWPIAAMLAGGCATEDEGPSEPTVPRVQLDRQSNMYEVSPAPMGPTAAAELARGAIHVVSRDNEGQPRFAEDETPIRHTCGAILIAPSYIVTAAHCVDSADIPDPETDGVTLEMYPTLPWLNWMPATTLSTVSDWLGFTHPVLGLAQGYQTERFDCELVMRCGNSWGPQHNCNQPNADTALLRCDDHPGSKYGFVDVATQDIDSASVFMPWAHEVYDIEGAPGDGLWYDHYTKYTSMEENLHYFGGDRNQLLPLRSVPRVVSNSLLIDNKKQGYDDTLGVRWTDLMGCHGTSGSPVLQYNATLQKYEYLGPISRGYFFNQTVGGGAPESTQLCQEPSLHAWGDESLGYSQLQYTQLVAQNADDCSGLVNKGPVLSIPCLKLTIKTDWPELWWPWDEIEACPMCGVLEAMLPTKEPWFQFSGDALELPLGLEPGSRHRLSMDVLAPEGVAGEVQVFTGAGELVASVEIAGDREVAIAALSGDFEADESGGLVVEASEGLSIQRIALAPEGVTNGFDTMMDRVGVGMMFDDGEQTAAVPMRFSGDGAEGFAAVMEPGERMVMTREALLANSSWDVSFTTHEDAAFRVGFVMDSGEEVAVEVTSEDGVVHTSFEALEGQPLVAFIDLLEGPEQALVDDVTIALF